LQQIDLEPALRQNTNALIQC